MVMHVNTYDLLSTILLQEQLVSAEDLEMIKINAGLFQQTVFQHILQYQLIDPKKLAKACAHYFKGNVIETIFEALPFEILPIDIIKNYFLLPIHLEKNMLTLAVSNPNDSDLIEKLSFSLQKTITLLWMPYDLLLRFHNRYLSNFYYQEKNNEAKVIISQLLSDAMHQKISDVHFEPYQKIFRIRFRSDGLLKTILSLSILQADAIISCLKVLAELDIAIKRMPQDGRLFFRSYLGFYKNCRISTCPTVNGEKMVIRLLDHSLNAKNIHELGLSEQQKKLLLKSIQKPQGLILVTGPTGSGKTITLYTLLNLLNDMSRNIVTIEDPIEMQIDGINQTAVNYKTGLNFGQMLRALLRQDPDVIMIGEIRDQDTAEMAIRAAETGHLVLSTLHTNSAAEAILRLEHMGVAHFHLASAIKLVVAQRLIRKYCTQCKGTGCNDCHKGYAGRVGVFELLPIDENIQQLILNQKSPSDIAHYNEKIGNKNLWQSAQDMLTNETTSEAEVYRVITTT